MLCGQNYFPFMEILHAIQYYFVISRQENCLPKSKVLALLLISSPLKKIIPLGKTVGIVYSCP